MFSPFAIHVLFPSFTYISLHHANRTWLYSQNLIQCLMANYFNLLFFELKIFNTLLVLANPNIILLSIRVTIICYDYRVIQQLNIMLVFLLTSWCKSNCVIFSQLTWLSADPTEFRIQYEWITTVPYDGITQKSKQYLFIFLNYLM